ncbi:hypothetical protein ACLB2K_073482 [Fragaria x ananassa]
MQASGPGVLNSTESSNEAATLIQLKDMVSKREEKLEALGQGMEKALKAYDDLWDRLQNEILENQKMMKEKLATVQSAVVVAITPAINAITPAIEETISSAISDCFVLLVPAFESSCQAMVRRVDYASQEGMASALQKFESVNAPLTNDLRQAISYATSLTETLSRELGGLHEKVEGPLNPRKELSRLVTELKYEKAFECALERGDVSWLCGQVDLHDILMMEPVALSQDVLLSLLKQLADDINNDTSRIVEWMTDVAGFIETSNQALPIFEQVHKKLHHQYNLSTITKAEQASLRVLMYAINSMMDSCK